MFCFISLTILIQKELEEAVESHEQKMGELKMKTSMHLDELRHENEILKRQKLEVLCSPNCALS